MRLITTAWALVLISPLLPADIVWTGAVSNDIFDEANWDLSASSVTVVNPNVSIDDDVLIANAAQPVEIPNIGGQIRFQVGDGFTFTLKNSSLNALGDDGVGGAPGTTNGPVMHVIDGAQLNCFFITNRVDLNIAPLSTATFGGGATPINLSTVNLTYMAKLNFTDEIVSDYLAEHLSKTTVDGAPAVQGSNIQVVSDGAAGCNVTVIAPYTPICSGASAPCPCGNQNNGSMGEAGCANSVSAGGASLIAGGSNSISSANMMLIADGLAPMRPIVFFQGNTTLNSGLGAHFGDGLRCAGGALRRLQTMVSDVNGLANTNVDIAAMGGVAAGQTRTYQLWYSDSSSSPCGTTFNVTNAMEVTWGL